ncbi:MAG: c-type cytochrome [Rubrivivax sp.]
MARLWLRRGGVAGRAAWTGLAGLACLSALTVSLGLAGGVASPARAQAPAVSARLAACGACHGADGQSQLGGIPSLAGQPSVFLENQLVLIREGVRDIPAMKGVLEGVSDAEISQLARHYAALLPPRPAPASTDPLYARGQVLAREARCGICHLPNYVGREQMPRLAGQREDYLLHSMRQFVANQAVGRDSNMAASLHGMADADLQALAHYLARVAP